MANRAKKWPQNVPGPYYVDEECIDCNLCSEIAPENFAVNKEEGHDFVHTQPNTEAERKLAEEALQSCPVEAIGRDGEE
ncbi:MAG: ferredoxin [Deltaproteobacteria bacterium]|nr:ferredoxin [Deltaproteobacteria bacterium]